MQQATDNSNKEKDITDSDSKYIVLRSGKIKIPAEQHKEVEKSLSKSLKSFYEEARLTGDISLEQLSNIENHISLARVSRLINCQQFEKDTKSFRESIAQFTNHSRLLLNDSTNSLDKSSVNISRNLTSEDFQLTGWKYTSIENSTQSSPKLSRNSTQCSFNLSAQESPSGPQPKILNRSLPPSKMPNTPPAEHSNLHQPPLTFPPPQMQVNYEKVVKLTSQMVPLFSGELNSQLLTDLQTFIGCCRQVQQCLDGAEKVAFMQIFPTRLRGGAYQLIASSTLSSFEEVEQLLYRTYLPRETYQELINKLITCRQFPQESFIAFASRAKQLLTKCKEAAEMKYGSNCFNAVKQQLEDFAIAAIKSGAINPHLSTYLLTLTEKELDPLIQKALDMEKLQQGLPHIQQQATYLSPGNLATSYPNNYTHFNFANNPISFNPYLNNFTPIPPINNQQPSLINQSYVPPIMEQQKPSSVLFNTDLTTQSNWSPTQDNFAHIQQNSSPSQNFANLPPVRTSNKPNKPLERVTCSFCKFKGHTYDECIKRKNTPYCVNCKINGHDARNCRRNTRPPVIHQQIDHSQNGNNSATPRVYNMQIKCDFCGRRGHSVNYCMQKQRWEAKNSGNEAQSTENPPARL